MILHLTKRLAGKLKLSPKSELPVDDAFFSWRANYVDATDYRFVIFMNDLSRISVLVGDPTAAKLKKLPELFFEELRATLLALKLEETAVDRYIADLGEITYSKNSDRKKTAQLNANTDDVLACLYYNNLDYGKKLNVRINNSIYNASGKNEDVVWPIDKIHELFAQRYGTVPLTRKDVVDGFNVARRDTHAVDLKVTLLLNGKNAIRRLRVPLDITFETLHEILQKAFEWEDQHLYSFDFYDEDPKKRSAIAAFRIYGDKESAVEIGSYDRGECAIASDVKLYELLERYPYIIYVYDFGDDWNHNIKIEKFIEEWDEKLPRLLSGRGDSPPEDVGGPYGFEEFLEILADPKDERHKEMCNWCGDWQPFDYERVAMLVKQ